MPKIFQQKLFLPWLLVVFVPLFGLAAILNYRKHAHEFSVQSIKIFPATSREIKQGYDSKVAVTIISTVKEAPKFKNRVHVGGDIICKDASLVASEGNSSKILPQKPRVDVISGSPSTVSFLYNKSKLPLGKITLQGTLKAQYSYNIIESDKSGVEIHDSPGMPVEVRIQ
jgi:hypothetical protein